MMDTRETEVQSSGVYMVYLIAADGSSVFLTLNQGASDLIAGSRAATADLLRGRAERIRKRLAMPSLISAGFTAVPPDLRARGELPRTYEAGSVVSKAYIKGSIPVDEALNADLSALARAYRTVIPSGY